MGDRFAGYQGTAKAWAVPAHGRSGRHEFRAGLGPYLVPGTTGNRESDRVGTSRTGRHSARNPGVERNSGTALWYGRLRLGVSAVGLAIVILIAVIM